MATATSLMYNGPLKHHGQEHEQEHGQEHGQEHEDAWEDWQLRNQFSLLGGKLRELWPARDLLCEDFVKE